MKMDVFTFFLCCSLLATIPHLRSEPTPYELYDPGLFALEPVDGVDDGSMFTSDSIWPDGDVGLLEWPLDSDAMEMASTDLDGLMRDDVEMASTDLDGLMWDDVEMASNDPDTADPWLYSDSGADSVRSGCISDADPTILAKKPKARRQVGNFCPDPGTNGPDRQVHSDELPSLPDLLDRPDLVEPLVLPQPPPEDQTECPKRFPRRLCCTGSRGELTLERIFKTVQQCDPCKHTECSSSVRVRHAATHALIVVTWA
jgi:hypothetical protein